MFLDIGELKNFNSSEVNKMLNKSRIVIEDGQEPMKSCKYQRRVIVIGSDSIQADADDGWVVRLVERSGEGRQNNGKFMMVRCINHRCIIFEIVDDVHYLSLIQHLHLR
jgi:hypothetical protein